MDVELEQHQIKWLSLIRYQLEMAEAQAEQPEPLNVLAISTTHDAVESMLSLVVEVRHVDVKSKADFIATFDAVNRAIGETIGGHRSQMNALNSVRVSFKHHGNRAEEQTIRRHLTNARTFLRVLAREGLDVNFDEVSLLLFISNEQVRSLLQSAKGNWSAGQRETAFQNVRLAFDELVRDYERRKSWHPGKSLFSTKPSFLPSVFDLRDSGKVAVKGFEWLEALDSWVRTLAFGIDARKYAYFDAHTPNATRTLDGSVHFSWRQNPDLSDDVFGRCQQFVVETALMLARDDFDFDAWAARRAVADSESASMARAAVVHSDQQ